MSEMEKADEAEEKVSSVVRESWHVFAPVVVVLVAVRFSALVCVICMAAVVGAAVVVAVVVVVVVVFAT